MQQTSSAETGCVPPFSVCLLHVALRFRAPLVWSQISLFRPATEIFPVKLIVLPRDPSPDPAIGREGRTGGRARELNAARRGRSYSLGDVEERPRSGTARPGRPAAGRAERDSAGGMCCSSERLMGGGAG